MEINLVARYVTLIENIIGRPYLNAAGDMIEALKWMYQSNNVIAYVIAMVQILSIVGVILFLPAIIVLIFIFKERRS